jgi:hypothetical protein
VASVDISRKIEILKSFAKSVAKEPSWTKGLRRHADAIEEVNRARNIAAHSVMRFEAGKAVLRSNAAVKLLRAVDLKNKSIAAVRLKSMEDAIQNGLAAMASGSNLLDNLERVAAERARRASLSNAKEVKA